MSCTAQLPWFLILIGSIFLARVCVASDIDALIQLKKSFGDPRALDSWNTATYGAPCIGWKGITCTSNSSTNVMNIQLSRVFSGGVISPSIGDLAFLESLDLSDNDLVGTIPAQISNLKNLTSLDLSHNKLSGSVPSDWTSLTELESLTLTDNQLDGFIPDSMAQLTSLKRLRLENNSLTGEIPPSLFLGLSQLQYFAIEWNRIGGPIPATIGACMMLRSVYAAHNQLDGLISDTIGNLSRLLHFDVEGNALSGPIPEGLAKLNTSSTTLNLADNNLTGPIPVSLSTVNASVFLGNEGLCGPPVSQACPSSSPVPSPPGTRYTAFPPMEQQPSRRQAPRGSSLSTATIVGAAVGGVMGAVILLIILCALWWWASSKAKHEGQVQNWFSPEIQANRRQGSFVMFSRNFRHTYEDIVSNAGFYDTAHVLGKGRLATVFKSSFPDGSIQLAVKVFKHADMPGNFEKEIETLASIKHPNLLMIRGFYSNPVEKVIFYDYLPTGTLYGILHAAEHANGDIEAAASLPDWTARLRIALGVAQALAYLHRGCGLKILHRDVKSTNILLETDMTPRLSDYALLQLACGRPHDVVETPGYTAPEVLMTKKYTEKSDVYSFGVVLLELITGKKAVSYVGERRVVLSSWVSRLHKERRGTEVYDAVALKTCPLPECMEKALNLAVLCVDENPNMRPTMSEIASVVEGLNYSPSPLRSRELRFDRPLLT